MTDLKKTITDAPLSPGCYIMRDSGGKILYIGKARVLRDRLRSYFSGVKDIKTATLLQHVSSIETIIVSSEYEAFLLENTLIKQHFPKYNINLKDGKTYPVIRITKEDFPRMFKTRNMIQDGSKYYGPFPNVFAVERALSLLQKIYPIRKCRTLKKRAAPCMYYHIKRCVAPCAGLITKNEYQHYIDNISGVLEGNVDALIIEVTKKMHVAASDKNYEKAAEYRDALKALNDLIFTDNSVVDFESQDRDYIAFASEGVLYTWSVFSMRAGKLTCRDLFRTKTAAEEDSSIETFMLNYYSSANPPPPEIFFAKGNNDFSNLSVWFKNTFGESPVLSSPNAKKHEAALAMAYQTAAEDIRKRIKERGGGPALQELANVLNLKNPPLNIEGFDIAQLDGKFPVASLISFKNGLPDKKNYRLFNLKSVKGIVDDFQAMREAVGRRYKRLLAENAPLPDLILIDGGIGQVNAAKEILSEIGFDCPLAGLAKRNEEIWLPEAKAPIVLPKRSEALKILQAVRDETHRFATNANQKQRSKMLLLETLQSIDGIGEKRAAEIIKIFGSLEKIAALNAVELSEKGHIKKETAQQVLETVKNALAKKEKLKTALQSGGRGAILEVMRDEKAQKLAEMADA